MSLEFPTTQKKAKPDRSGPAYSVEELKEAIAANEARLDELKNIPPEQKAKLDYTEETIREVLAKDYVRLRAGIDDEYGSDISNKLWGEILEEKRLREEKRKDQKEERRSESRLASHLSELQHFGLPGLEGRMQRGLDPAGMLAVGETKSLIDLILKKANVNGKALKDLTKDLHTGAVWSKADDLSQAEKPEIKAWMMLAEECHEVNDKELSSAEYLADVDRIKQDLKKALENPQASLDGAVKKIIATARQKFIKKDGVPYSEEDAFLHMAIAGEKYGVCKAGELYFAGAKELDYSFLEQAGLVSIEKEDRGRMATFFQRDGADVVKKLYSGLAIVFGDEQLALKLAKSAEKFL